MGTTTADLDDLGMKNTVQVGNSVEADSYVVEVELRQQENDGTGLGVASAFPVPSKGYYFRESYASSGGARPGHTQARDHLYPLRSARNSNANSQLNFHDTAMHEDSSPGCALPDVKDSSRSFASPRSSAHSIVESSQRALVWDAHASVGSGSYGPDGPTDELIRGSIPSYSRVSVRGGNQSHGSFLGNGPTAAGGIENKDLGHQTSKPVSDSEVRGSHNEHRASARKSLERVEHSSVEPLGRLTPEEFWNQHELIHPEYMPKIMWDLAISVLIVVTVLYDTFALAFLQTTSSQMEIFNWVVFGFFIVDIGLSFITSFVDDFHGVETSKPVIVVHYLKSWFAIDLLSTIPFDVILRYAITGSGSEAGSTRMLRVLRLLRLVKILRLRKVGEFFIRFTDEFMISPTVIRVVEPLFILGVIAHLVGCLWQGISISWSTHDRWLDRYADTVRNGSHPYGDPAQDFTVSEKYTASLYWALVTMTTVGFGDVVPAPLSTGETLFAMAVIVFGSVFMGYLISSIVFSVASSGLNLDINRLTLPELKEYFRESNIPESTGFSVKRILTNLDGLDGFNGASEVWDPVLVFPCDSFLESEMPLF